MDISTLLLYGSVLSPVLPIAFGFSRRKALNPAFVVILVCASVSLFTDVLMLGMASTHTNNMPVAHLYGLIEGILLLCFFGLLNGMRKKVLMALIFVYSGLYVLNSIFFESLFVFNAYSRSGESLLMLSLCLYSLYQFYVAEEDIFIEKSPQFWFVIAILVYFSGALFSFLLSTDMLSNSPDRFYGSWILHNASNALKNVIFALAFSRIKHE